MVTLLFGIIYILFILGVVIISFFMVTRLQTYSINPSLTRPLILLYMIITTVLVIINFALFFAIPFDSLLPTNLYY